MRPAFGADTFKFLQQWVNAPLVVGAVAPSGPALAELITSRINSQSAPVLELGPGTGVFSRALIARGLRERDLTLVEFGAEFASMLKTRFPEARILRMDAADIGRTSDLLPASFGAAVSGLPLLSMPVRKVTDIVAGAFKLMRPGGALFQFTYGPSCPVPRAVMDHLGLQARKIGGTLLNVPPASVYEITAQGGISVTLPDLTDAFPLPPRQRSERGPGGWLSTPILLRHGSRSKRFMSPS